MWSEQAVPGQHSLRGQIPNETQKNLLMAEVEMNFSGKVHLGTESASTSMCVHGEGCGPCEATASDLGGDRD